MDAAYKDSLKALDEVRNMALMLSVGNTYLCEEVFLKKIGYVIDSVFDDLEEEILALKRRFPGKFAEDVDTDGILEELQAHAEQLQDPSAKMNHKCASGQLGRELEEIVSALTVAVKDVISKVEGELPDSAGPYSFLNFFLRPFKTAGSLITGLSTLIIKLLILLLIIAIGPFAYLFLSMEKGGPLQKEISQSESFIQSQREAVSSLDDEREQIGRKIEDLRRDDLTRQEKIDIMELNVKIHGLDAKRHAIEVELNSHENRIRENRKRIEEIRKKPFLKRLLRR